MKKLKVLYKRTGRNPEVVEIEDTLIEKQKSVGGLIEIIPYYDKLLICNENGKLDGLKPNVIFDYDYIAGNFFIVNDDYKNAGFKSLNNKDIECLKSHLKSRSVNYSDEEMKEILQREKEELEEFYKDYEKDIVFNEKIHNYELENNDNERID